MGSRRWGGVRCGGGKFRSSRFKPKKKKEKSGCNWVAQEPGLQGVWKEVRVLSLGRKGEMELAGPDLASCGLSWGGRDPHPLLGQVVCW